MKDPYILYGSFYLFLDRVNLVGSITPDLGSRHQRRHQ